MTKGAVKVQERCECVASKGINKLLTASDGARHARYGTRPHSHADIPLPIYSCRRARCGRAGLGLRAPQRAPLRVPLFVPRLPLFTRRVVLTFADGASKPCALLCALTKPNPVPPVLELQGRLHLSTGVDVAVIMRPQLLGVRKGRHTDNQAKVKNKQESKVGFQSEAYVQARWQWSQKAK